MRSRITLLSIAAVLLLLLAGCSAAKNEEHEPVITAALFPEYDWTRQILGSDSPIRLELLIDSGTDPHSYQPTAADILLAANCDLLIYGGGESEEWIRDAVDAAPSDRRRELVLMEELDGRLLSAAYTEGMQVRVREAEADEHIWLSLRNARICCERIADRVCELDPENAPLYRANLADYLERLDELDRQYCETAASGRTKTILVADRFPFHYLTEDYGLTVYAAFPGCSAESGASFRTILFLTQKLEDLSLPGILIPDGSDGRIARTLAQNVQLPVDAIYCLDSMQAVSLTQAKNTDYLTIMGRNLEILTMVLK